MCTLVQATTPTRMLGGVCKARQHGKACEYYLGWHRRVWLMRTGLENLMTERASMKVGLPLDLTYFFQLSDRLLSEIHVSLY